MLFVSVNMFSKHKFLQFLLVFIKWLACVFLSWIIIILASE